MQTSAAMVAAAQEHIKERSNVPAIIKVGEEICKRIAQVFEEQGLHKKRLFLKDQKLSLKFTHSHKPCSSVFFSNYGYSWEIATNIFGQRHLSKESISICSDYNRDKSTEIGNSITIKYPNHDFDAKQNSSSTAILIDRHDAVENIVDHVAQTVVREALLCGWRPRTPAV